MATKLLTVGRLHPEKGLENLLDAMPAVLEEFPDAVLDIAGGGDFEKELREKSRDLNLDGHVNFLGFVENPLELRTHYESADLYVHPALNDNQPFTILDAIKYRVPVVASDIGGIPFLIEDGVSGLLAPQKDPTALAQAIVSGLSDREGLAGFAEAAYQSAKERFPFETTIGATFDLYDEILNPGNSRKKRGNPEISIVVPTYNRREIVNTTIDSLLDQNFTGEYEVVVVDDGSIDGTFEHLQSKYQAEIRSGKVKVLRKENGGVSTARNVGFKNISDSSEVVIFIDSDDVATPDRIQLSYEYFKANPEKGLLHGKAKHVGPDGSEITDHFIPQHYSDLWQTCDLNSVSQEILFTGTNVVHNATVALRVGELEKIMDRDGSLFTPTLNTAADYDLGVRIAALGKQEGRNNIGFLNTVLGEYLIADDNMTTSNEYNMQREVSTILNRKKSIEKYGKIPKFVLLTDGNPGGPFNHTKKVAEYLFEAGVDVTIVEQSSWYDPSGRKCFNVYDLNSKVLAQGSEVGYWDSLRDSGEKGLISFKGVLEKVGPDSTDQFLVLTNQWADEMDAVKGTGVVTSYTVHSLIKFHEEKEGIRYSRNFINIQERLMHAADKVVAMTENYGEIVRAHYPEVDEKLRIVPYGLEAANLKTPTQKPYDPNSVTLLGVGRLDRAKGWLDLVEIMKDVVLELPNTRLLIAGGTGVMDNIEGELHEKIREYRLDKNVKLLGNQDRESLERLYETSDIFVLPTWHENFSLAVTDAVIYGKPMIVSQVGSIEDMIEPGVDGLAPPPKDIQGWKDALRWAIYHPNEMVAQANMIQGNWIDKGFTIENCAQKYIQLWAEGK